MSTHINQDFEDAVRAMERGASDHQSAPNASANLPGADAPTGAPAGEGEGVSLSPAPGQCRESAAARRRDRREARALFVKGGAA